MDDKRIERIERGVQRTTARLRKLSKDQSQADAALLDYIKQLEYEAVSARMFNKFLVTVALAVAVVLTMLR